MTRQADALSGEGDIFQMHEFYRTGDEIEDLAESFSQATEALHDRMMENIEITREQEKMSAELNIANRIKADMLPSVFPLFPDRTEFDLFASMDPAKEVGGDFYDAFLIDEDHLGLVIADVSGKGVPAALFMVISKTLIRTRALQEGTPSEILRDVNHELCNVNNEGMFVTVLSTRIIRCS
ncbi:MAG: SpoIIE family protein phosphatase [Eubacterium sp.]|nr:SpoIIE family protein phosphatase [Eubacterium sp.]